MVGIRITAKIKIKIRVNIKINIRTRVKIRVRIRIRNTFIIRMMGNKEMYYWIGEIIYRSRDRTE